ncbi:MAG: FAD-dependent oxidoreductase, partial [Bacteroidota bacterium]
RPALDAKQAGFFQRTAEAVPAHGTWWSAEETAEHVPEAVAPHGALRVRTGGALDVPAFCARLIEVSGAEIVRGKMTEWSTAGSGVRVSLADGRELTTDRLLLAHGDGAATHPALAGLSLHRILGETLRVRPPAGLKLEIPLSAGGYVVPTTEGHLLLGSTYRHDFGEVVPSEEGRQAVLAKTTRILPALRDAEIIGHRAGVRVTVPNIRLPMAGPLPDQPNVWLFTALGSKGALMAPLIAQDLPGWLADVDRIPESLRVR